MATWEQYDDVDSPAVNAVLDVIAPREPKLGNERYPAFEWGREEIPLPNEVIEMAEEIVENLRKVIG